jgi:ParB-like chromosome segregation protein Spo0J
LTRNASGIAKKGEKMNQQVVYQDISQIHPYENNPRNNEAAIEPVAQSIKRFGFRVPILIDGKGTIIAGHTRYEAAKRLGMDKVPCIRVDDLTDEQIRAYRIADNKVAEASSWNDDVLRAEMDALKALDVDLTDTGFSEVELDGLLREVEDADFEEFFTEPVQQPPKAADAEQSAETQQSTRPESSQLAVPQQSGSKLIQCPHCGEWFET